MIACCWLAVVGCYNDSAVETLSEFGETRIVDSAWREERDPKRSAAMEHFAKRRAQEIEAEIERLDDHPWAGKYYYGDGLGVNVTFFVAPDAGYLFEWHGCMGLYDRNYGAVQEDDGRIRLSFTLENIRQGFQGIADEFVHVEWAGRSYLVPSDGFVGFCNEINSGDEPRDQARGEYLLRAGDEKKEVIGFPKIPKAYRPYLLSVPVEAKIVAVGDFVLRPSICEWNFKDTTLVLDAGKNDGLLPGMLLRVVEPDRIVESATVVSIEDETCKVVMTQCEDDAIEIEKGWKLSTLPRWNAN